MGNEREESLFDYSRDSQENIIEHIQPLNEQILNTATLLCQEEQIEPINIRIYIRNLRR